MLTEDTLTKAVILHGPEILDRCLVDPNQIEKYLETVAKEYLDYPVPKTEINIQNWLIPEEYKILDIESFLVNVCPPDNYPRLVKELELYHQNNMIPVLKTMKYIVDALRKNNIVWGVGRGSSVASYVLFLIGVHKIDSVKYNLPIEEFFKGEQNG